MIRPGLYGPSQLLGAKVRIISSPGFELFGEKDNEKLYFISRFEYRLETDGKLRPAIELEGLPNRRFLPGDLCVVELPMCNENQETNHGKEN